MKNKYTQRCLDIVYLMQNNWILIVGRSDTNDSIYYQVTKGYERDYFHAGVFGRLLSDGLIHQQISYPFDWVLTKEAKELIFKTPKTSELKNKKMETHYTNGYGGKLNYLTICGKEIHSHSEKEEATIHTEKVTCKKCLESKEWIEDSKTLHAGIKNRIFIESDILHADALRSAQRTVAGFAAEKKEKYVRRVFSKILDRAWHNLDQTWSFVKSADEIYAESSLMPLIGGSYTGAPVIFNGMCERAVKENITGKDVYILNNLKNVNWDMIKVDLMKKAFKNNNLFMYDDNFDIVKVDISKIKKK